MRPLNAIVHNKQCPDVLNLFAKKLGAHTFNPRSKNPSTMEAKSKGNGLGAKLNQDAIFTILEQIDCDLPVANITL